MHTGDNSYKHIMWRIKNENINKSNKIWRIMCRSTEREENKKREQQMEKINSKKNVALLSTSSTASYSSRHSHLANTFFSAVAFSRRHWSCKCKKKKYSLVSVVVNGCFRHSTLDEGNAVWVTLSPYLLSSSLEHSLSRSASLFKIFHTLRSAIANFLTME